MKRLLVTIFSIGLIVPAVAQVKQEVIASAGGHGVNGNLSISWTLGETIIPTYKSSDNMLILTHGFQQQLVVTTVEENLGNAVEVSIFPNPASEAIRIRFTEPLDTEVKFDLVDSRGEHVITGMIEVAITEETINLQDLSGGVYFLRVTRGNRANVYKIVKL
jgi:hypothetical protein